MNYPAKQPTDMPDTHPSPRAARFHPVQVFLHTTPIQRAIVSLKSGVKEFIGDYGHVSWIVIGGSIIAVLEGGLAGVLFFFTVSIAFSLHEVSNTRAERRIKQMENTLRNTNADPKATAMDQPVEPREGRTHEQPNY